MSDEPEDEEGEGDSNPAMLDPDPTEGTDYSDAYACRGDVVLRSAIALHGTADPEARKLLIALGTKLMATIPAAGKTHLGAVKD